MSVALAAKGITVNAVASKFFQTVIMRRLDEPALHMKGADWNLDISSNSTAITLEPTDTTVLGKKLSVLRLAGKDRLRYDIRFSKP